MMSNRIQLNLAEIEVQWQQIPTGPVRIGSTSVSPVATVRDLGVYLDADVSMAAQQRSENAMQHSDRSAALLALTGALKMREWKIQEWKMREHIARVENAGVENSRVDRRGGKCRSDKVWKAIRRKYSKVTDEISASMPTFVGELKFRILIFLHFLDIYTI